MRTYTLLNHESPEFIRFVNPGDLRVAHISCGGCHAKEVLEVRKSMMTHGCMLWGAALYNNGTVPFKQAALRRELQHERRAAALADRAAADARKKSQNKGVVPYLDPLPRFEISAAGQHPAHLRARRPLPPRDRHSRTAKRIRASRAPASASAASAPRTAPIPVFIGLQKTRLLDPTLNFLGTNDHPGDYRSSGCTACHVVYANDRSPVHSGPYAKFGHSGIELLGRPDDPEGRAGPSDRAPVHAGDSDQPVHRLPRPPRHQRA